MKELDVLLEAFMDREQDALCAGAWPELENLLAEEDDCLWRWMLDPSSCTEYPRLIQEIARPA